MKYVNYDEKTGKILGFYSKDIHGKWIPPQYNEDGKLIKEGYWDLSAIPKPYAEMTDEMWQECLNGTEYRYKNGSWVKYIPPTPTLDDVKARQKTLIKAEFEKHENDPVTYNNITWNGGENSAFKINGAVQLAQKTSATQVTLWDSNNNTHVLSLGDAEKVAVAIALAYEEKIVKKHELYAQVDKATTVDEVKKITW